MSCLERGTAEQALFSDAMGAIPGTFHVFWAAGGVGGGQSVSLFMLFREKIFF